MAISLERTVEGKDLLSAVLPAQTKDYSCIAASLLYRWKHPLTRVLVSMHDHWTWRYCHIHAPCISNTIPPKKSSPLIKHKRHVQRNETLKFCLSIDVRRGRHREARFCLWNVSWMDENLWNLLCPHHSILPVRKKSQ